MPRTTKSTTQALDRLATAVGWTVTREDKKFLIHTPGVEDPPIPKNSARALAYLVTCVRHWPNWPALQEATAFDPGTDVLGRPKVSDSLAAWEQTELRILALTTQE